MNLITSLLLGLSWVLVTDLPLPEGGFLHTETPIRRPIDQRPAKTKTVNGLSAPWNLTTTAIHVTTIKWDCTNNASRVAIFSSTNLKDWTVYTNFTAETCSLTIFYTEPQRFFKVANLP